MHSTRSSDLETDLDLFLRDLCVEWGFCNDLAAEDLLANGEIDADRFARAVLTAEGFDADAEARWHSRITATFVERYGQAALAGLYRPGP